MSSDRETINLMVAQLAAQHDRMKLLEETLTRAQARGTLLARERQKMAEICGLREDAIQQLEALVKNMRAANSRLIDELAAKP